MLGDPLRHIDQLVRVGEDGCDSLGNSLSALEVDDNVEALVLDALGDLVAEVRLEAVVKLDRLVSQQEIRVVLVLRGRHVVNDRADHLERVPVHYSSLASSTGACKTFRASSRK